MKLLFLFCVLIVLPCYFHNSLQQEEQPSGWTGLKLQSIKSVTGVWTLDASGISNNTIVFSGLQSNFRWDFDANSLIGTASNLTSGNVVLPNGVWIDTNNQWSDSKKMAVLCHRDSIWQYDIETGISTLIYVPVNNLTIATCVIDFEHNIAWLGMSRTVRRVYMKAPGGIWTDQSVTSNYPFTMISAVLDKKNSFAYFGTNGASIVQVPLTYSGSLTGLPFTHVRNVGAGSLTVFALDYTNDIMFIGTSIGLALRCDLGDFTNFQILFIGGNQYISTIFHDENFNVTFFGTRGGNLYRTNNSPFNQLVDSVYINCTLFACGASVQPIGTGVTQTPMKKAYLGIRSTPARVAMVTLHDCSVYSDCSTCLLDPYCGWCSGIQSCGDLNNCTAGLVSDENFCPALISLNPTEGSIFGDTLITVTGSIFVNDSSMVCRFGGISDVPVTYINPQTIQCKSPSSIEGSIELAIYLNGKQYGPNTLNFTYYVCDGVGCDSCNSAFKSECRWCVNEGVCGVQKNCSIYSSDPRDSASLANCPNLIELSPSSGIIEGGTEVFLRGSYFSNEVEFLCNFGGNLVNASRINDTTISCISPSSSLNYNNNASISVLYLDSQLSYTFNSIFFYYFKCEGNSCYECMSGQCTWCLDSNTCSNRQANLTCNNKISSTASDCPAISGMSPRSVYTGTPTLLHVTSTLYLNDSSNYECHISYNNFGSTAISPATLENTTTVSCINSVTQIGNAQVRVVYKGVNFTSNTEPLLIYDCAANSCGDCVSLLKTECRWCLSSQQCGRIASPCTDNTALSQCPSLLSVTPSSSHIYGGTDVLIAVSVLVNGNYSCSFGSVVVEATKINDTFISCKSPSNSQGQHNISLLLNGYLYTPQYLPFFYYVCGDFAYDCDTCLSNSFCSYCLPFNCVESNSTECSLNFLTSSCPTLTSMTPDHSPVNQSVDVTISGGKFINSDNYQCNFQGDFYTAIWNSFESLTCLNLTSVSMTTSRLSVYLDGNIYSNSLLFYDFYDCDVSMSQQSCSQCQVNPSQYCGWCLSSSICGTPNSCSDGSWTKEYCPAIASISPSYASIEGNTSVVLNVTMITTNYTMTCHFGSYQVPAHFLAGNQIECLTPSISSRKRETTQSLDFYLSYLSKPFTNIYTFDFLDCNSGISSGQCSSCTSQNEPRCAYCVSEGYCGLDYSCPGDMAPPAETSQCPVLSYLRPVSGPLQGDTLITIYGDNFPVTSGYMCNFDMGSNQIDMRLVIFQNETVVQCKTPPRASPGDINVYITLNGHKISDSLLSYSFVNADPESLLLIDSDSLGLSTGGIIGIICALVVIAAILASLLFLVYRRRTKLKKLIEPDYAAISFSAGFPDYSLNKERIDVYSHFEELLIKFDYLLPTCICEITATADIDMVTRALVYTFETHRKTVSLINHFVTLEINNADNETALFRAHSPVAKAMSNYNKLIGLRYLWQSLALAVHELNDLGQLENTNQNSTGIYDTQGRTVSSSIMAASSLEVDPLKVEDVTEIAANQYQLMLIAQKLFNQIIQSFEYVAPELRQIYSHMKTEISKRFPNQVYKVLASFLFGRYICPAILAPHVHGLLEEPPNQSCQRYLILISKTLQHLASGTLPEKKDEFSKKIAEFISINQTPLHEYIDKLAAPVDDSNEVSVAVPVHLKHNALALLHYHVAKEEALVKRYCENQDNGKQLVVSLSEILDQLGTPSAPKSP